MFDRFGRNFCAPIASRVAKSIPLSITPLSITGFGLLAGIACAVSASQGWIAASLVLWWVNRVADGLDGALFRFRSPDLNGQTAKSDLGGYADLMADFVTYAIVPVGIAWQVDQRKTWISLSVLLTAFYINLGSWTVLAAIQEKRGWSASGTAKSTSTTPTPTSATTSIETSIAMPSALIEGTETIVAYSMFLIAPRATAALFAVFALLVAISAVQRIDWARRNL
jgi:phosphatidylglycerophosphate synthase